MKLIKNMAALLTLLFLFSCSAETTDEMQPAVAKIALAQLQQQWLLVAIDGQTIAPQTSSTLDLTAPDRATGNLACNRFFGTLAVQNKQLKIEKMGSTRKMCLDQANAVEQIVGAVLSDWSEVFVDENRLTLIGKAHRLNYKSNP